ncbi:hypothetical protein ACIRG5_15860 [Lentzea sp. NPDC102401]|uniref:hypothetical protein n=1 Tax=Lentzea sp. NPDC102401 TaxID=3364128 RepID=UPI003820E5A3
MPKMTVLRLLVFAALVIGCTLAYEALPAPERSLTVFVVMFAGPILLRYWANQDSVGRKPADGSRSEALMAPGVGRQVWRVRLWVRIVAVVVPLVGLLFVFQPRLLNPEWTDGLPVVELVVVVLFYVAFGFAAWAAFRSRLELDESWVRVTNPWESKVFLRSAVRSARQGSRGVEFVLDDGSVVTAFALQCVGSPDADPPPRWVAAARAVTGRDPVTE